MPGKHQHAVTVVHINLPVVIHCGEERPRQVGLHLFHLVHRIIYLGRYQVIKTKKVSVSEKRHNQKKKEY